MAVVTMLALHPAGDYVSDEIRRTGDYFEREILDELASRLTGGVLVDAGAMIGNHTAYLAEFVAHDSIHAFEPIHANAELLRRNVRAYPSVVVHEVALSDRHGTLTMTTEANMGHSRVESGGLIEVTAMPLDALELMDVALLKVDVEGHEPEVLVGASQTIARCRPLILLEDWTRRYGALLPDYRVVARWEDAQTFLYEWAQ